MQSNPSSRTGRIGIAGTQLIFERLGCIFREQPIEDYGIDAHVEFIENGQPTGKLIALQIKSGESWFKEIKDNHLIFRGNNSHLEYWQNHSLPVIIVLYNDSDGTAYWQAVNKQNIQRTKKNWKLLLPLTQKIDHQAVKKIEELSLKIISTNQYSELSLADLSNGKAKKYSAHFLLNREFTKDEIIQIIKDVTVSLKKREYYKNSNRKNQWKNKEAHVIWLYLYLSLEDFRRTNWICMSQWISQSLSAEFSPIKIEGENIDKELVVEWNKIYKERSRLNRSYELPKETYLDLMIKIADPVQQIVAQIVNVINEYESGKLDEARYINLMSNFESKLTPLYLEGTHVGSAPIECRDLSQQFQNLIGTAHNLVLPFSELGLKNWEKENRKNLVQIYLKHYDKELQKFKFEFEKIH